MQWPQTTPSDLYKAFRATFFTVPFSGLWGPVPAPTPVPDSTQMSTNTNGFDSTSYGDIGYGFPTVG